MGMLDIVIALIVLFGLWRGFAVGFIRSSISLVGWFIALLAATRLADDMAPHFAGFIQSPVLQIGAGFLAVVLLVMLVIQLLTLMVSGIVNSLKLGFVDKFLGGILGAAKNVLVVLVLLSISAPALMTTSMWQTSVIAPELLPYAPFAKEFTANVLSGAWEQIDMPDQAVDAIDDQTVNDQQ